MRNRNATDLHVAQVTVDAARNLGALINDIDRKAAYAVEIRLLSEDQVDLRVELDNIDGSEYEAIFQ